MKAAVCNEWGKPLVIEDVEIDPPRKGQIKLRVAATAICHSDIHCLRGELHGQLPMLAGHESAGYVEEVGPGVSDFKKGDPIIVSLITSCGHCRNCLSGLPSLCEDKASVISPSPLRNKQGQTVENMAQVASFAEYAIVDQSQAVKIPADMPMDRASLLGCGVITGFNSVINRARVKPMQSVVVVGVGGVGINSIQGAAYSGAYPVIAVDVLDNKLQSALSFGATHTVNAKQVDPIAEVQKITEGRGADYVFITVGSTAAMKQGFLMSGRRGMTVLIGLPNPKETMTVSPYEFIHSERMLTGCDMGATNMKVDIPKLITLYKAGKLKLDELITGRYNLEQINEAIESVERGEAIRNVIIF